MHLKLNSLTQDHYKTVTFLYTFLLVSKAACEKLEVFCLCKIPAKPCSLTLQFPSEIPGHEDDCNLTPAVLLTACGVLHGFPPIIYKAEWFLQWCPTVTTFGREVWAVAEEFQSIGFAFLLSLSYFFSYLNTCNLELHLMDLRFVLIKN